jgi:hypothetical protein
MEGRKYLTNINMCADCLEYIEHVQYISTHRKMLPQVITASRKIGSFASLTSQLDYKTREAVHNK